MRIIALAPSINENIYALGAGDKLVANTTYATYPKEAIKLPKVGGYFSISLEKILMLKPTLVFMQKNNLDIKPKLALLGIKTELIASSSMQDIKNGILKIAKLTHTDKKAKKLIQDIDKAIKNSQGILKDKKILIVFGRQFNLKREIFISGNSVYFSDIIRSSENQNAYKEISSKQPLLSYEGIVKLNPDIIYILAHETKNTQQEKQKLIAPWLKLPITASKSKTIYVNTNKYASMPSYRVVEYIRDFTEVLKDAKGRFEIVGD
jgi:iron complex transport system substrate-binding protein